MGRNIARILAPVIIPFMLGGCVETIVRTVAMIPGGDQKAKSLMLLGGGLVANEERNKKEREEIQRQQEEYNRQLELQEESQRRLAKEENERRQEATLEERTYQESQRLKEYEPQKVLEEKLRVLANLASDGVITQEQHKEMSKLVLDKYELEKKSSEESTPNLRASAQLDNLPSLPNQSDNLKDVERKLWCFRDGTYTYYEDGVAFPTRKKDRRFYFTRDSNPNETSKWEYVPTGTRVVPCSKERI